MPDSEKPEFCVWPLALAVFTLCGYVGDAKSRLAAKHRDTPNLEVFA